MDTFIEKIVTKRKSSVDFLKAAGIIVLGLALIVLIFSINSTFIGSIALALVAGVGYLVYILITSLNIEYEYIVTNGEIDIDKIISRRKRKRIFSANCKDFDIIAKVKSEHYNPNSLGAAHRLEAVSSMDAEGVYFATLNYKGNKTVLFFEPNERMLDNFKTYIPRKVFR